MDDLIREQCSWWDACSRKNIAIAMIVRGDGFLVRVPHVLPLDFIQLQGEGGDALGLSLHTGSTRAQAQAQVEHTYWLFPHPTRLQPTFPQLLSPSQTLSCT